jgi:hypothetical protein
VAILFAPDSKLETFAKNDFKKFVHTAEQLNRDAAIVYNPQGILNDRVVIIQDGVVAFEKKEFTSIQHSIDELMLNLSEEKSNDVIIWGHGEGTHGTFLASSENEHLSFKDFTKQLRLWNFIKIDTLVLATCLMQEYEAIMEMPESIEWVVGSSKILPAQAFDYTQLLQHPTLYSSEAIKTLIQSHGIEEDFTLSVASPTVLKQKTDDFLKQPISKIQKRLEKNFFEKLELKTLFYQLRRASRVTIDLGILIDRLAYFYYEKNREIYYSLIEARSSIYNNALFREYSTNQYNQTNVSRGSLFGLSIFFPQDLTNYNDYLSENQSLNVMLDSFYIEYLSLLQQIVL